MKRTAAPVGDLCPTDPAHGPLLDIDGRPYCPHQSHDEARIVRRRTRLAIDDPKTLDRIAETLPDAPAPAQEPRARLTLWDE